MIAHVRGRVSALSLNSAVFDVGGVGVLVQCSPGTLAGLRMGAEAMVHTSLVVREDSLTVFGFAGAEERDMFELVQTASGVGPKVAQAMMAVFTPDRLRQAIGAGDLATLTQVPGIGRKGAERIVVELKDRIGATATEIATANAEAAWRPQVHEALTSLGWSTRDADTAVEQISADHPADADVPTLLRLALRTLAKER